MNKIILIFGLSGSGKTSLALELAKQINATHLNADKVREYVNTDLDFSRGSRVEQAYRMGMLANRMVRLNNVVVDFICPTNNTRSAFQRGAKRQWDDFLTIWMNTENSSKYLDTDRIFEKPDKCTLIINTKDAIKWAKIIRVNMGNNG